MNENLITAEQARELVECATLGPWSAVDDEWSGYEITGRNPDRPHTFPIICDLGDQDDAALIAAAPELASKVIAQDAQIKRLQNALREADEAHWWDSADLYIGPNGRAYKPDFVATYNLLPGDMEPTNE